MAKVRFQMFLEQQQRETLENLHGTFKLPMAELVRQAINQFVAAHQKQTLSLPQDKIIHNLLSVGGICHGRPRDLADQHDHYLYGVPPR